MEEYPAITYGPLLAYNEDKLDDIIINDIRYKYDKYGNITGFKNGLFAYDSGHYLEMIGTYKNCEIKMYKCGYFYH
tara:strand:- start:1329 stop:1556 length:228 start_codon:yes stop_codon:yes gene_type:complete